MSWTRYNLQLQLLLLVDPDGSYECKVADYKRLDVMRYYLRVE